MKAKKGGVGVGGEDKESKVSEREEVVKEIEKWLDE